MYRYTIARILLMIPTIIGAAALVFFLMRIIPGDICLTRWVDYGTNLDPLLLELCRENLGLNDPLFVQFINFISNILTRSFGNSIWHSHSVYYLQLEEIRGLTISSELFQLPVLRPPHFGSLR